MLARLKVTPNVDNYKNQFVHDRTMREISNPFETNSLKKKKKKNNVHSDLYQQYAFYDNNIYRLSTLGLSLYPKENKHLHYPWFLLN